MRYIREALGSILEEENEEMSFDSFLDKAEVVLVDNAFDFDINKWEEKNQEEIDEELSEDTNNKIDITTSQFIKYQLTPDKVKEIVNKIINSEFNIINYWKTNQFKKKNNLTDDDLKDILRTLTEQDYKTNSISIDNSKNEAIIFIKQTNIKNLNGIELYIKLDYDSIENSPVIVISFHNVHKKSTLTSSYNNVKRVNDDGYSNSELLEETSPYTNIKSNGIYSLYTGWVKHPVQQNIPDIDMEEFEKEFKVWEDRYFDLLDELNKQNDTLNEVSEKQGELDLVKIEFIEINSDCPMIDFINSIENEKLKTKTIKNIYKLADLRNKARPPLSEYIDDGIFELRTKFSSNITRAFYFFIWGDKIVMTNGYIKKSQKLDIKEFNKAKKLMNNYLKSKANLKESEDKISTISIDDYLKDCLKNEEFRKTWYSNDKEDVEKENKLEGNISDNQSKLEKIDDMIEDIYNLRKEGMEEDGEYSIKNLIFKEFRNLGYLDNLKNLRKKEISKELSLEQLQEYKDKMNIEMLKLLEYSNDVTEINQEDKKLKGEYRDLGVQGNYHIYESLDAQAAVSLVQGFNQLFTGRAHKSDNISLLKSAKIIWNFHNENGERYFIYLSKYTNLAKYVVEVHPKLIGGYKEKFFKGCFIEETNFKIYNIKEEGLETSLDYVALSKLSLSPILNAGVDLVLNGTLFVEDKVYDIKNAKLTKIGQVEGQTFFIQTKNDYIDSTSIPISAFGTIFTEGHWRDLKKIEIPHNVKTIKNYTFSNCYTLTYMSIPNSVEEIGSYAFENCYQINAVIVPKSVKIVKSCAFNYCHNLTIYCEAESQPEGWDKDWNPDNRPVVWGYKKHRENN